MTGMDNYLLRDNFYVTVTVTVLSDCFGSGGHGIGQRERGLFTMLSIVESQPSDAWGRVIRLGLG